MLNCTNTFVKILKRFLHMYKEVVKLCARVKQRLKAIEKIKLEG